MWYKSPGKSQRLFRCEVGLKFETQGVIGIEICHSARSLTPRLIAAANLACCIPVDRMTCNC